MTGRSVRFGGARLEADASLENEPGFLFDALKQRKQAALVWRCSDCRHEFSNPSEQQVATVHFTAHYESTFVSAPNVLTAQDLKLAALKPNNQLSIEEVDLTKLAFK